MSQPLPPKKEVAYALLENSSMHVHLDPRRGAVVVPPEFRQKPQLILQIGLNMPVPIPDLHLDDEGMSCTLSFNRSPFHCVIPWSSVFAMVDNDGRGMVWPDDLPPEVHAQARMQQQQQQQHAQQRQVEPQVKAQGQRGGAPPVAEAAPRPAPRAKRARKAEGPRTDEPRVEAARVEEPRLEQPRLEQPRLEQTGTAKKRSRKKPAIVPAPAAERGRLVALPPPAAAGRPRVRDDRPAGRPKTKRELPPYLRVVK